MNNSYRRFLENAARNAILAKDVSIYERAFQTMIHTLGSVEAVQNQWVPTPALLETEIENNDLASTFPIDQYLNGLFLGEYLLENPDAQITWDYFSSLEQRIAKSVAARQGVAIG